MPSLYRCLSRLSIWHLDLDSQRLSSEEEMTEKLNPEVKTRWVAALRSGKYQQTQQKLTDFRGRFCCLGVLCDLYAEDKGINNIYDLEGSQMQLPGEAVCDWAGVNVCNAKVEIGGVECSLFTHNDGAGEIPTRTFAEIANAIEAQL